MRFFSIGFEGRNLGLMDSVIGKLEDIRFQGFKIEERKAGNLLFINYMVSESDSCGSWSELRDALKYRIAEILSDFIVNDLQHMMIDRIIEDEYFYFENEDREQIRQEVLNAVFEGRESESLFNQLKEKWHDPIRQRILEHLDTHNELIVEGFIRFRLKDFMKELIETVDKIVEELLVEREYNEFIKLLRYFVEIQEPKVREVHVLVDDDRRYILLDDSMRVINNDILKELAREISDTEMSYDDLLISSLITIAPSKITIHGYDKIKNTELLNTINKVFRGKVVMSHEGLYPQS
ncbi:MAG: putative sporulation protein YtxC [Caldicoprobacter oshimai]|uniref:Putative sporulation protein YtxC n=1 Tax=Caldicoprobacter faecalis TaxID=937334 RepID=A0A1I5XKZ4_9FIRM|nr:putative sporulation protein YtxC [Caldicoprobacter faecalis]SFQ32604.1 putative sporulation protein YtxC [Caldicoprobacter faecalis]